MILDGKELELAAVGISISAGCVPCTRYHIAAAKRSGAQVPEVLECVRAAIVVASKSLADLRQQFDPEARPPAGNEAMAQTSRIAALTSIGAAVSQNNVKRLKLAIGLAKESGINDNEIMEIAFLAKRIKEKAASHLESTLNELDANPEIASAVASLCA